MTMTIAGHYLFHLPIEVVYDALRDESLIRHALPGQVRFRMTTPTHYEAAMTLDVPRFGGLYEGTVDVVETQRPTFYTLSVRGTGHGRSVEATGTVFLTPLGPEQTEVRYEGQTDAFDDLSRIVRMAAPPVAVQFANRGLHHLEQVIQALRQRPP